MSVQVQFCFNFANLITNRASPNCIIIVKCSMFLLLFIVRSHVCHMSGFIASGCLSNVHEREIGCNLYSRIPSTSKQLSVYREFFSCGWKQVSCPGPTVELVSVLGHVTVMWLSCDRHVAVMWPSCDRHVTVMWLSCDCHVAVMWPSCDCHVTASDYHSDGMVSRDELVQYFLRANQQLRGYFKHAFVEHTFLPPVTCEKCGGLVRSGWSMLC